MSIPWMNAATAERRSKNAARLVLFVLADRADHAGVSFYGIKVLAEKTNLAERAVHYAVKTLVTLDLLKVEYKKGPHGCNIYTLQNLHGANDAQCKREQATLQSLQLDPAKFAPNPSGSLSDPLIPSSAKPQKVGARASVDQLRSFAVEEGLRESDGEAFFNLKEGNGWRNGKNPVENWKATFRSWKANGYHPSQKGAGGKTRQPPIDRNVGGGNAKPISDYSRVGKLVEGEAQRFPDPF